MRNGQGQVKTWINYNTGCTFELPPLFPMKVQDDPIFCPKGQVEPVLYSQRKSGREADVKPVVLG